MGTTVVQLGHTRIIVHSPHDIGELDRAARQDWATRHQTPGNAVLNRIVEVMVEIYQQADSDRDEKSLSKTVDK